MFLFFLQRLYYQLTSLKVLADVISKEFIKKSLDNTWNSAEHQLSVESETNVIKSHLNEAFPPHPFLQFNLQISKKWEEIKMKVSK